jgi:hypothetical protein
MKVQNTESNLASLPENFTGLLCGLEKQSLNAEP